MLWWLIPLIIAVVIVAIFNIPISLRLKCFLGKKQEITLDLKILFFKIRLFPAKRKKIKIADFTIKKFRKMRLKEERLRKKKFKIGKREKKKKKTEKPKTERSNGERINAILKTVRKLILAFIIPFKKHARLKLHKLDIVVAEEDCDKTAILYGSVCSLTTQLLTFLDNNFIIKFGSVNVQPDFVYLNSKCDLDLELKMNIRRLISTVLPLITAIASRK